jgi:DNA-binding IscR family transcriptional regulator
MSGATRRQSFGMQRHLTEETPMDTVEDFILGNSVLHDCFFATTEILAKLVSNAPRAVGIAQLAEATGRPARELTKFCTALERAGLLHHDPEQGKWVLTCDASMVTLEDVFRCTLAQQKSHARPSHKTGERKRLSNDVDLLLMQAIIAINQSVFKHLRQFSLDRLKISAAGMFPATRPSLHSANLDDAFDLEFPGRQANPVSPLQVPA